MVEDVLPSSVTYVTSTPEAMGTTSLMWDAGDLGPGDSFTADVVVSVNAGTQGMTISNSFDAWATNAETITVDADDLVVAWVDLQGAKMSEADDPLMAGMGAITYTLTVSNEGTLAASSVVVTDMLPSQVMVVSGTTSVDVGTYNWDGDVFSWTIPSLAAGADVSASFVVTVNAGTEGDVIGNMMYVDGMMIPDADPPEVFSDLTLAKLAMDLNGDDVYPDDVIEYQVWLTNTGTVTHYNVMISDTLPAQLSYEAASATCSVSATCGSAAGVVTASLPSLAVGEVFTLTFEAMVQSVPDPMQVCNTAYAWSDEQPNMLHAMACLDVDVAWTYVYMPLMLRQSP
jgi:uncharacterized repeat protein (TIGR01451 family)